MEGGSHVRGPFPLESLKRASSSLLTLPRFCLAAPPAASFSNLAAFNDFDGATLGVADCGLIDGSRTVSGTRRLVGGESPSSSASRFLLSLCFFLDFVFEGSAGRVEEVDAMASALPFGFAAKMSSISEGGMRRVVAVTGKATGG